MSDQTSSSIAPPAKRRALLTHDRLLGRRVYLHAIIRFFVAGGIAGCTLFARFVVGIEGLDVIGLFAVAIAILIYNIPILLASADSKFEPGPERLARLRVLKHISTLLDYIALTAVIWFLGGIRSPFIAFYLFHLIIASILLPRRAAVFSALTAAGMLAGLAVVEITGILPPRLPEAAVVSTDPLDTRTIATILSVNILLFGLTTTLVSSLAAMLRDGEKIHLDQAAKLEQLNLQRRELLHLTLHNLQSPIAAAGMLLRNLHQGLCGPLEPEQRLQVERSLARLDSVTGFIQDLSLLSKLESGDLAEQIVPIDMKALLEEIAREYGEQVENHQHELTIEVPPRTFVQGVPRLVREALVNYLTNAIKYTPDGGSIRISASSRNGRVRIEVTDNGIGIPIENHTRVFGEYVRLAPKDPRLGKTEGTGIGLSIVKKCIERQSGQVGFDSTPGKGSTFWMELPAHSMDTPAS